MNKVFIGIDVGKDGGIVALNEDQEVIAKYTIPRIGTKVNYKALNEIFKSFKLSNVVVAIEDVHAFHNASAKSTFSFGEIKGFKIGSLETLEYRYIMVQPKAWQKRIWNIDDMVYKPKKPDAKTKRKAVDTKKTSLLAANRLFPGVDFRRTEK